ncbi:hypothetical protein GCM10028807_37630 [Spirosoma daeguense]
MTFYIFSNLVKIKSSAVMADIAEKTPRRTSRLSSLSIPPALIDEMWNGKPIYYRGCRDILAGKKTIDEVMSFSGYRVF